MTDQTRDKSLPLVCAVVPAFNRCDKTLRFLRKFAAVEYPNRRVVIVDDGSSDGTKASIELNYPDVPVLEGDGNLWWSGGTNVGVRYALEQGADYILTINDDCVMEPDFLTHMVAIAQRDPLTIVGCRLQCQDRPDEIWSIGTTAVMRGGALFALNYAGQNWSAVRDQLPDPLPVDTLAGNGVLLPRGVFEQVGFYDDVNMPQYHADSDLVSRARRAGFRPVVSLRSVLYNHILEKPLVNNRIDLIFSKKSDRYWRAVRATLRREAPFGKRTYLLLRQYTPFFANGPILRRIKRVLRWLFEWRRRPAVGGLQRDYNPTCDGGPAGETPVGAVASEGKA